MEEKINKTDVNSKQFVIFTMEEVEYAIDINKVTTIERVLTPARVPRTPNYLIGVINLRGDIIPVLDLRRKFDLPELVETEDTRIVIVKINEILTGFIVDMVEEVVVLKVDKFDDGAAYGGDDEMDKYVEGVGRYDNNIVTILNLEKLVSITEEEIISRN